MKNSFEHSEGERMHGHERSNHTPLRNTEAIRQASRQAFDRDFPELLERYPDQWVAYANGTMLGIKETEAALIRKCLSMGYDGNQKPFMVFSIEPQVEMEVECLTVAR